MRWLRQQRQGYGQSRRAVVREASRAGRAMITRSLSRLHQGRQAGAREGPRRKGVLPRRGGAERPGPPAAGTSGEGNGGIQLLVVSTHANNPTNAWNVNFNDGNVNNDNKSNTNFARAVRAARDRP